MPSSSAKPFGPTAGPTAIQGELGSNSHRAALLLLGPQVNAAQLLPCVSSAEVFDALAKGAAANAVLPIENSLHGSVFEHYDLLLEHGARIVAEALLRVEHHVIAAPGVTLADLTEVSSHPVALSQCRRWLAAHPRLRVVPAHDTAGSVRQVMASGSRTSAGVAPALAAELYGGQILASNIEDHAENYTRFYLLEQGKDPEAGVPHASLLRHGTSYSHLGPSFTEPDPNKLTVAFTLAHQPGALLQALQAFAANQVNLTRIESRPVHGRPWEYVFFADGQFDTPALGEQALEALREACTQVTLLGLYRAAE